MDKRKGFGISLCVAVWCAVIGPAAGQSAPTFEPTRAEIDATAARSIVLCDVDQPQVYLNVVYKPDMNDCETCTDDVFRAERDRTDVEYAAIISSSKSVLMRFPNGYSPSITQSRETRDGSEMYCVSAEMPDGMAFKSLAPQVLRSGESHTREFIPDNTFTCITRYCRGCCPSGYCLICMCSSGDAGCDPEEGFVIDAQLVPFHRRYI